MSTPYPRKLVVDGKLTEVVSVQTKVEQDVAFLQHRLDLMKKHPNPNRIILETYENMLKSRMAVLSWLRDGDNKEQGLNENIA